MTLGRLNWEGVGGWRENGTGRLRVQEEAGRWQLDDAGRGEGLGSVPAADCHQSWLQWSICDSQQDWPVSQRHVCRPARSGRPAIIGGHWGRRHDTPRPVRGEGLPPAYFRRRHRATPQPQPSHLLPQHTPTEMTSQRQADQKERPITFR